MIAPFFVSGVQTLLQKHRIALELPVEEGQGPFF